MTQTYDTKHHANQRLSHEGFRWSRAQACWYHSDGRHAVVEQLADGSWRIGYSAPAPLETRVWEQDGVWHWTVRSESAPHRVGDGEAPNEAAEKAAAEAVIAATRRAANRRRVGSGGSRRRQRRGNIAPTR